MKKKSGQTIDSDSSKVIASTEAIVVTEKNVPSPQVIENFAIKLLQIKERLSKGGETCDK